MTRRDWNPTHAAKFKAGMLVDAWDTSPRMKPYRIKKGLPAPRKVATIRLTVDPRLERLTDIPPEDWEREGFAYLQPRGIKVDGVSPAVLYQRWTDSKDLAWVVRFEVVEYLEGPLS